MRGPGSERPRSAEGVVGRGEIASPASPGLKAELEPQESLKREISSYTLVTALGAKWGLSRTSGDNRLLRNFLKTWSLSVLVGPGWDKCRGLKIRVSLVRFRPWAP